MQILKPASTMMAAIVGLSLLTGACATKKHVREAIAPVQTQVTEVQKTTTQHTQAIGDLDRNVARADEHAMEADKKATAAGQSADKANQAAMTAQQKADVAGQSAQAAATSATRAYDRANTVATAISENFSNYKLTSTEKVYFRSGHSEIGKEDQAKLDAALQQIQSAKNYVIEVEGYADRTGNKAANVELARRRAEAVVRYLTVEHNIPLRTIHNVAVGSVFPNADNKTRVARKENRRVDLKVYALDLSAALGNAATPSAQTPTPPSQ